MANSDTWILAIDMGTSSTVVATRVGDQAAEVVEVDGQRTVPSVVFVDEDGSLPVGMTAVQLGAGRPDRAVRAPKRRLDIDEPIVVGGRALSAVELVAALLRHGAQEAIRMHGSSPTEVRLAHPVAWSARTLSMLGEASVNADLGSPRLIPEPIAAAHSLRSIPALGQRIAIYDLGGETFDAVALEVTEGGFAPVSKALGSRAVGGELLDEMIMAHVGERVGPEMSDKLLWSDEPDWIRANRELRRACRAAKESISSHPYAEVAVMTPDGLLSERLARSNIDELASPLVDETMSLLSRVIEAAGGVDMIHLVGGGSRLPLVAQMIAERWPDTELGQTGDPRVAVALGAATVSSAETTGQLVIESERVTPPAPPPANVLAKPPMPARPAQPGNPMQQANPPLQPGSPLPVDTPSPVEQVQGPPAPARAFVPAPALPGVANQGPSVPVPAGPHEPTTSPSRVPWFVGALVLLVGLGVAGVVATRIFGDQQGTATSVDLSQETTTTSADRSTPSDSDDGPTLEPNLRRYTVGTGPFIDYVVSTTDTSDCPVGDLAVRSIFEFDPGPTIASGVAVETEVVAVGPDFLSLIIERCNREIVSFKTGFVIEDVLDSTTIAPLELTPTPLFLKNVRFDRIDNRYLADVRFEPGVNWRSVSIDVVAGAVTDLGRSTDRPMLEIYPGGLIVTDALTLENSEFLEFGSSRSEITEALNPFLFDERQIEIPESCEAIFDEVIFYDGVALGLLDDEMIGWYLMPEFPLSRRFSPEGIGISSHIFEISDTGADIETFTEEDRKMIRFNDPGQLTGFDDFVASVSGHSSVDFIHEMYAGVHCEELVFRFR